MLKILLECPHQKRYCFLLMNPRIYPTLHTFKVSGSKLGKKIIPIEPKSKK